MRKPSTADSEEDVSLVVADVRVDNDQSGRFWCAGFCHVSSGLVVNGVEYWVHEQALG